jgi:hypothetical protein
VDEEEAQTILAGCDALLRKDGLNAYNLVTRMLAKLPKAEPVEEEAKK